MKVYVIVAEEYEWSPVAVFTRKEDAEQYAHWLRGSSYYYATSLAIDSYDLLEAVPEVIVEDGERIAEFLTDVQPFEEEVKRQEAFFRSLFN